MCSPEVTRKLLAAFRFLLCKAVLSEGRCQLCWLSETVSGLLKQAKSKKKRACEK